MQTRITNITESEKGVNPIGGPIEIKPGQTVEVDLPEAEMAISRATGWFEIHSDQNARSK